MKIKLTIFILLVIGVAAWACASVFSNAQDIYLPKDFRGHFAIVYGCECNIEEKNNFGRAQMKLPANRILLTSRDFKSGINNTKVFIKEGKDFREIPEELHSDSLTLRWAAYGITAIGGERKICKNEYGNSKIQCYIVLEGLENRDSSINQVKLFKEDILSYLKDNYPVDCNDLKHKH